MLRGPAFGHLALTLLATCVGLGDSNPAFACGSTPCSELEEAQPSEADNPVPLNAELRVRYFGAFQGSPAGSCDLNPAHLRLVPRNATPIDVEGTTFEDPAAQQVWVTAKPAEALLPYTMYTLQVPEGLTTGSCTCGTSEWVTASTFTTGGETDEGPPEFSGVSSLSSGAPREAFTGGCNETNVVPVTLELATPAARSGLRFNIYVDGVLRQRYVAPSTPGPAPEIAAQCTPAPGAGALLSGGSRVEVRAVDLAGNESAAHAPLVLSATCQAQVSAVELASSESAPDAAPTPSAARQAAFSCALAASIRCTTRGALWALSLALLGLARRRAGRERAQGPDMPRSVREE